MKIGAGWMNVVGDEFKKEYMLDLQNFLKDEYSKEMIYPSRDSIFRSIESVPFEKVKVVILGQDPYHGPSQANGLAFAVKENINPPPSLKNIFKEIKSNYGEVPNSTTLDGWSEQGVLLLNTVLTVRNGQPNSHKGMGWEVFTDKIIESLGKIERPLVFMLWGKHARDKKILIQNKQHLILEAPHPSPLSAHKGFLGCQHFNKANDVLKEKINWISSRSFKNAY